MKTKWFFSLNLALALMLPMAASASTILMDVDDGINPFTADQVWASGKVNGSSYRGSTTYQDVVGVAGFDTKKMVINLNPFTIDIYTKYQPGGIGTWGVADIAINATSATTNYNAYTTGYFGSISSNFEYGIDMQAYYSKNTSANNVTLKNVTTWATTFSFVNPQNGYTYGGGYRPSTSSGSPTYPVENVATFGSTLLTGDMTWQYDAGLLLYVINIDFKGVAAPFNEAEFLWGTAKCGNDIVHGSAAVPIPGTLVLLGSALIGLAGAGFRQKKLV